MFICSICMEERTGDIGNQCCGFTYCGLCCLISRGLCYVCDKDTLNWPQRCSKCSTIGNAFTITECMSVDCDLMVCNSCKFKKVNNQLTFCSLMCNMNAYLSFMGLDDVRCTCESNTD